VAVSALPAAMAPPAGPPAPEPRTRPHRGHRQTENHALHLKRGRGASANQQAPTRQNGRSGTARTAMPASGDWRQNGGYLRRCGQTEVALRDEFPLNLSPRPAEFTAADWPHARAQVLPCVRRSTLSAADPCVVVVGQPCIKIQAEPTGLLRALFAYGTPARLITARLPALCALTGAWRCGPW
jgi:hypothetical protein